MLGYAPVGFVLFPSKRLAYLGIGPKGWVTREESVVDRSRLGAYSESELDLVGFDPNRLLAQISRVLSELRD